jgi:hypothetical protein
MVTTGKLPSWIFQLAETCKFLFPMETRALIFHMSTFDRERALQQLKIFSPDSVGARIAHITGLLPTKQITVNREFTLGETKVVFDRMLKHDNYAISEVKFTDEVSSYFLLNCPYYLIDVFYFSGRTWGWSYKRVFFDFIERDSKVRSATMARRRELWFGRCRSCLRSQCQWPFSVGNSIRRSSQPDHSVTVRVFPSFRQSACQIGHGFKTGM